MTQFKRYLKATTAYYSTKKTLLYAEKPHPFYELYVCNDIGRCSTHLENATIEMLEEKSNHIIIQGTGGIGKSMLLTHLFLSSAANTLKTGRMPVLINVKNYQQESSIVAFVLESIREFEPYASESQLLNLLEENKLILLLDGLDEIKSALMDSFEKAIDSFIKGYGGNTVVITSRPVNKFIAYSKFLLLDIEPLTLEQSVNLVKRLKFWDKEAQKQFLVALKNRLYNTHKEFASNPFVTAKLFCHRNCSPKLSKNIKKLLPIMPSITAHMSYLFWSPKEKRLVHPTRDVNWRRFQEDFEEILEA